MTAFVLIGATAGLGLLAVIAGVVRSRAPLAAVLRWYEVVGAGPNAVSGPAEPSPSAAPGGGGGALAAIGRAIGDRLPGGPSGAGLGQDLALLERDGGAHVRHTALAAISGATVPVVVLGSGALFGLGPGVEVEVLVAVAGGAGAAYLPTVAVRRAAAAARTAFVHALSCWLELVALAQAGGMGIEGALEAAGSVSDDATFVRLRLALVRARQSGRSPWQALAGLGQACGVAELEELAASVSLAGTEGARIRSSLTAKSESLRRRQTSEAEKRANETTERLFVPAIVLMVGFMVFLIFPAAATLSHVLR